MKLCATEKVWLAIAASFLVIGASAATMKVTKSWRLYDDVDSSTARVSLSEAEDGIDLITESGYRYKPVKLTKDQAASLGHALLEAAGEKPPEPPKCPSNQCPWCVNSSPVFTPNSGFLITPSSGEKNPQVIR